MAKSLTKVLLAAAIIIASVAVQAGRGQGISGQDNPLIVRKCNDFKITGNGSSEQWRKTEWVNLTHQGSDYIDYVTREKCCIRKQEFIFFSIARIRS